MGRLKIDKCDFSPISDERNNRSVEIMTWTRPIPVSMSEIKIGKEYYTCSYGGTIKVTVVKIYSESGKVLVKQKGHGDPFVRSSAYIFPDPGMAKSAGRNWEHDERNRKSKPKKGKKD